MAATNISASGGLDLLQLANFIDVLNERRKGRNYLKTLGPAATTENVSPAMLSNPAVAAAWQQRVGGLAAESEMATQKSARDVVTGDVARYGASPAAIQAAALAKQADTSATKEKDASQMEALRFVLEAGPMMRQGGISDMIGAILTGGGIGGLQSYMKNAALQRQKQLDALEAERKPTAASREPTLHEETFGKSAFQDWYQKSESRRAYQELEKAGKTDVPRKEVYVSGFGAMPPVRTLVPAPRKPTTVDEIKTTLSRVEAEIVQLTEAMKAPLRTEEQVKARTAQNKRLAELKAARESFMSVLQSLGAVPQLETNPTNLMSYPNVP